MSMQQCITYAYYGALFVSFFAYSQCAYNIDNDAFVINTNTGVLYPPSIPVIVSPGDEILICTPPGLSSACYLMVNETCLTLRNACISKTIDKRYSYGSTLYFKTNQPTLYKNKVQPWSDPALHCLLMLGRHGDLFSDCVKAFSKYENITGEPSNIFIGPGYDSIQLTTVPQVSASFKLIEQRQLLSFIIQLVFALLTIPLIVLKSKMHTN